MALTKRNYAPATAVFRTDTSATFYLVPNETYHWYVW